MLLQLHELLTYLGQRGVLTVLTVGAARARAGDASAPVDVSYLADGVLLFRYFEADGAGAQGDLGGEEPLRAARDDHPRAACSGATGSASAPPCRSSAASSPACRSCGGRDRRRPARVGGA